MEFDKSKVYTALNADESQIGAKGYFAESLCGLIRLVKSGYTPEHKVECVDYDCIIADDCDVNFNFFYLVEPAPEKWYVYEDGFGDYTTCKSKLASMLFEGTRSDCEKYISEHSKPKYRPFKDCDELANYSESLHQRTHKFRVDLDMPLIWVKAKSDGRKDLITSFNTKKNYICVDSYDCTFDELLDNYTFLDGSPCGVKEE